MIGLAVSSRRRRWRSSCRRSAGCVPPPFRPLPPAAVDNDERSAALRSAARISPSRRRPAGQPQRATSRRRCRRPVRMARRRPAIRQGREPAYRPPPGRLSAARPVRSAPAIASRLRPPPGYRAGPAARNTVPSRRSTDDGAASADGHRHPASSRPRSIPTSRRACRRTIVRKPARARNCRRSSGARPSTTAPASRPAPSSSIPPNTYLYLVLGNGKAIRYGIGVGREGFTWAGAERVTRMAEWPDWHPPAEMIERQPYLPRFMAGGEGNPLGARALYLGKTHLPHPRHQPAVDHRHLRVVGLHPSHQRGRHRPLLSREGRHPRGGAARQAAGDRVRCVRRLRRSGRQCRRAQQAENYRDPIPLQPPAVIQAR